MLDSETDINGATALSASAVNTLEDRKTYIMCSKELSQEWDKNKTLKASQSRE